MFLEKVASAKNIIHGYTENEWQGSLREEYRVLDPNIKGSTNTWKTVWHKDENIELDKIRQFTSEPREIKTPSFTFMNKRTPMNFLVSTDPKPSWQINLDAKS